MFLSLFHLPYAYIYIIFSHKCIRFHQLQTLFQVLERVSLREIFLNFALSLTNQVFNLPLLVIV